MLNPLAYRSQFHSLEHQCHLISNSLGAMPDRAADGAAEYARIWQERGVRAWHESWWELPREVGDQIGRLMNAAPDSVSMHLNVTTAQATILSCFEITPPRDKVVMVDMEFPSILYLYREWLRDRGHLEIVPSSDGIRIDTQLLLEAIDERTLLVPISHVLFRSSTIMDVDAIVKRAHEVGACVVLDVFQSLGTVSVDVTAWNVDFAVGGCLKWLCGGPGACYLYVRPDLAESLRPRLTGWMAQDQPFAFDTGPIQYTKGSYRFMNGTANIPALYTCRAGLELIEQIGSGAIRERSMAMTAELLSRASDHGWLTTTPILPAQRAGTVAIDVPNGAEIAFELNTRDVLVDYRPQAGIRISPHFYNTDEELEHVIGQIESIQREGAWRNHSVVHRIVT